MIRIERITRFIAEKIKKAFYGKITLVFEGGKIMRVIEERSLKDL